MDDLNFYEILGIVAGSDAESIKRAFRKLAKRTHPDMHGGERAKFDKIREAYEFLSQENLRKDYDQQIKRRLAEKEEEKRRLRIYSVDIHTKIEIILAWSTEKPSFDTSFVNSCLNNLAEGKELSPKQINSIENIIVRFKIDLDRWFDDKERDIHLSKYFDSCLSKEEEDEIDDAFSAFNGFVPKT